MREPTENLSFDKVVLRFVRIIPGDERRGFVPQYHFRILTNSGLDAAISISALAILNMSGSAPDMSVTKYVRIFAVMVSRCKPVWPLHRSFVQSIPR